MPVSLALVGAGKMGGAMLEGWLATGLSPSATTVIEPRPSGALTRSQPRRASGSPPMRRGCPPPPCWFSGSSRRLCRGRARDRPADRARDAAGLDPGRQDGRRRHPLHADGARRGTGHAEPAGLDRPRRDGRLCEPGRLAAQLASADALLSAVGIVEWVGEEALVDAVTALSGSGPAYLFHLAECMAEAGAAAGLDPALADRLARATIVGAAELMASSGLDPAELRRNVTSPGGTTAAALDVLGAKPASPG